MDSAISLQMKLKIMTEMYLSSNEALKEAESENKKLKLHIKGLELQLKKTTQSLVRASNQRQQISVNLRNQEYFIGQVALLYENEVRILNAEKIIDRNKTAYYFRKFNEEKEKLKKSKTEIEKLKRPKIETNSCLLNTAFSEDHDSILQHQTLEIILDEDMKEMKNSDLLNTAFCEHLESPLKRQTLKIIEHEHAIDTR